MSRKSKGSNAERDLVHRFNAAGWSAIRSAGSGSMVHESPDVLAGNNLRRIAVECKTTKDIKKYLTQKEVDELLHFANNFGAEPWIGIKFDRMEWSFINIEDAVKTDKSYMVDIRIAKNKGLSFDQLIGK
jgi:Holliday junction resolvase